MVKWCAHYLQDHTQKTGLRKKRQDGNNMATMFISQTPRALTKAAPHPSQTVENVPSLLLSVFHTQAKLTKKMTGFLFNPKHF